MDKQRPVSVERVDLRGGRHTEDDVVAHEEPLGIRIPGVDIAVVMRTPGNDLDLVRGFLLTEGIVPVLGERAAGVDEPEPAEALRGEPAVE